MLKRLYVNNYKCLVNVEINFDKDISLFLGANGSGKSHVFEILEKLVKLIHGTEVNDLLSAQDVCRSLSDSVSELQIELDISNKVYGFYKYQLVLAYNGKAFQIKTEKLWLNDQLLLEADKDKAKNILEKLSIRFNTASSMLSEISDAWGFSDSLENLAVVTISKNTYQYSIYHNYFDYVTYEDWLFDMTKQSIGNLIALKHILSDVLPGFDDFTFDENKKTLKIDFIYPTNKTNVISYDFKELSEGQQFLIVLHTLVYCISANSVICLDQPEKLIALPEIQPWFDALYDQCNEKGLQALLISHHPKLINLLANESGYLFKRKNDLTSVQKINSNNEAGISIAELIDRGWIYEQ